MYVGLGKDVGRSIAAQKALEPQLAGAVEAQDWGQVAAIMQEIEEEKKIEQNGRAKKSSDSSAAGNHPIGSHSPTSFNLPLAMT
jgi:hypothetical protein